MSTKVRIIPFSRSESHQQSVGDPRIIKNKSIQKLREKLVETQSVTEQFFSIPTKTKQNVWNKHWEIFKLTYILHKTLMKELYGSRE